MFSVYQRIILCYGLSFMGSLYSMYPGVSKSLPDHWNVSVKANNQLCVASQSNTSMSFSQDQISSFVFSMSAEQQARVLHNSDSVDSMTCLIEHIIRHDIHHATFSPTSIPAHSAQKPDFMEVRDRVRGLISAMPHQMVIPTVTIDRKTLGYRAAQMQGNISELEFEKFKILTDINSVSEIFRTTIWRGWVQQMEQCIRIIDKLLQQEITSQLHKIRTGRLCDAEAVVAAIAARWPYNAGIVCIADEHRRIQEYIDNVGFHELKAAKALLAQRSDYQHKVAAQKAALARQKELERQQALAKQQELERQKRQEIELAAQKQAAESALRTVLPQGMQHEIIDVLASSTNHTVVAQKLDTKIQEVLQQAELHHLVVHPELDWRLQAALRALPESVNAEDFTFHLATVEHLVNDMRMQAVSEHKSLIERSPALLAQAVNKYFECLAPTETELALIVDLARYVSDATVGTEYLSAEVREQRIAQFWHTIDSLSFDNLSKLNAEQIIDSAVYIAARATYVVGAYAAISIIKKRFIKVFDSVIGANPALITNEGAVLSKKRRRKPGNWFKHLMA
ncbi:MAG: hypothetical protein Q8Q25_01750 [bacterium]|nr:hypothetical protein [bacterium]